MAKVLFITNIAGSEMKVDFCIGSMTACDELGLEFHSVANRSQASRDQISNDEKAYGIYLYHADISRSPLAMSNIKAYKQIVNLIKHEGIDYIHCNTPVGGLLGRLAGKKCKVKKVIYQAHGFHFYKGAPLKNRLIYETVERWLAHYTDALITINQEDYEAAKKFKLRNRGQAYFVHGVGINVSLFQENVFKSDIRKKLNLNNQDIILISAGELNENKNNRVIFEAMAILRNPHIHYILCGTGALKESLEQLAVKKGIEENVHFLGYRSDISSLYTEADVYVMPSFREGLSRSMMEAMASGLPCIASEIRGNTDLIENGAGGFLCPATDVEAFAKAIDKVARSSDLRQKMRAHNLDKIKQYDVSVVEREMTHIYEEVLLENK